MCAGFGKFFPKNGAKPTGGPSGKGGSGGKGGGSPGGGMQTPSGAPILALFAIPFTYSFLSSLASPGGKEISWQEFVRDFLESGTVMKIVVVNNKTARVYLQKDGDKSTTDVINSDNSAYNKNNNNSDTTNQTTNQDGQNWGKDNEEDVHAPLNNRFNSQHTKKKEPKPDGAPDFFFTIG